MRKQIIILAIGLFCLPVFLKGQVVKNVSSWISSSPEKVWEKRSTAKIGTVNTNIAIDFEVFPASLEQKIDGFGGCFNELGWDALNAIKPEQRIQILKDLFDPNSGCRFSI